MSHPIDKKAVYMARYPKGSVLELTAPMLAPASVEDSVKELKQTLNSIREKIPRMGNQINNN